MLRVSTILVLVLANLWLISCFPTVNVKKPSENEAQSNKENPLVALYFLGDYNGKTWMIGRTAVTYSQAVFDCGHLGFSLASPNQAELNFLYSATESSDDFAWLGGYVPKSLDSFRWNTGSTPSNIPFYADSKLPSLALVLDRYPVNTGVRAEITDSNHFYICIM